MKVAKWKWKNYAKESSEFWIHAFYFICDSFFPVLAFILMIIGEWLPRWLGFFLFVSLFCWCCFCSRICSFQPPKPLKYDLSKLHFSLVLLILLNNKVNLPIVLCVPLLHVAFSVPFLDFRYSALYHKLTNLQAL